MKALWPVIAQLKEDPHSLYQMGSFIRMVVCSTGKGHATNTNTCLIEV
jgi:hypothetical protein